MGLIQLLGIRKKWWIFITLSTLTKNKIAKKWKEPPNLPYHPWFFMLCFLSVWRLFLEWENSTCCKQRLMFSTTPRTGKSTRRQKLISFRTSIKLTSAVRDWMSSLRKDHGFLHGQRPALTQWYLSPDTCYICHSKRPLPSLPSLPSLPLPSHFLWSGNNYSAIDFGIFKICHNGQMPQCSFSGGHGGKGPPVANSGPSKGVTTAKPAVYQHKRNRQICVTSIAFTLFMFILHCVWKTISTVDYLLYEF